MGNKVVVTGPWLLNPLFDAGEIEITGRIALANGYSSRGELVPTRNRDGPRNASALPERRAVYAGCADKNGP
jgi:hypothetical protein